MSNTNWDDFTPVQGASKPANTASATNWDDFSPVEKGGTVSDLGKSLKAGVQRLPGMATGLADLPFALAAGARPFTKAADALGEATGFRPGKWADETQFSQGYEDSKKAVDAAWKDGKASDIAGAYLSNPGYTLNQVAESLPSMVAGGVGSKVLLGAGRVAGVAADAAAGTAAKAATPGILARTVGEKWAVPVAAGVGEGAVTAGQQMSGYQGDDQQKGAVAALGAGVGTGLIGVGAGRLANKMGLETAETAMARIGSRAGGAGAEVPLSLKQRVLGGMVSEAVLQELPQSAQEQMWSNFADGKPIMEGVARAGTEGALAGGVMGAGANLRGGRAATPDSTGTADNPAPDAPPLALGNTPDPLISFPDGSVGRQSEVDRYINGRPEDQRIAERAKLMGYGAQPADASSPAADAPPSTPQEVQQLGYSPLAGTPTVFPDGSVALGSEAEFAHRYAPQPVKQSEAMGIDPAAGPLSKSAALAVDSGAYMPPAGQAPAPAPEPDPVVLQNRDRTSAASIAQMQEIAANPDYLRVGPSRDMTSGAPIVFGELPPTALLGRPETVVDGHGERMGTQYAVVDAGDLIASNNADGTAVAEYATGAAGKLRSVAGNGRTAGLQAAYQLGTAQRYRQELAGDAASLGVDAQALAAMQRPVLVRVMQGADVTRDMGDRTNITATQKLSPLEQAGNDARRLDVRTLSFDEGGSPTLDSIKGFVSAMPVSERGDMLNADGTPTRQAVDRLMAATFKQAYDSDELVQLYAQATDPDARAVMAAAADASGVLANLKGTGEFDVRAAVADAAKMAVNAARQGLKLSDVLKNADIDMNPEAYPIAEFMAQNLRSPKKMAEGLRRWGQLALEQAQIAEDNTRQGGLLGPTPTLTRAEIFARIGSGDNPANQAITRAAPEAPAPAQQADLAQEPAPAQRKPDTIRKALAAIRAKREQENKAKQPPSQSQQAPVATESVAPQDGVSSPDTTQPATGPAADENKVGRKLSAQIAQPESVVSEQPEPAVAPAAPAAPTSLKEGIAQARAKKLADAATKAAQNAKENQPTAPATQAPPATESVAKSEADVVPAIDLTAPTKAELLAKQEAQEAADKQKAKDDAKAAAAEKAARDKKDVDARMDASADNFKLGQDANDAVSGQGGIFDAPAQESAAPKNEEQPADDLDAMFDDLLAGEMEGAAPGKAPAAPTPTSTPKKRAEPKAPAAPRKASEAAASAVKNTAAGLANAIDGLGALFGANTKGRLGSGVSFDESTYKQAKPLFLQAVRNIKDAGSDIRAAMQAVIRMVMDKFGPETAANMKPYIVRFASDVRDGTITKEELNAPDANASVERDSQVAAPEPAVGDAVQDDAGESAKGSGEDGGRASRSDGGGQQDGVGVPFGSAPVAGERGDQPVPAGNPAPELESILAGADFGERGGDSGITGVPPDSIPAAKVDAVADKGATGLKAGIERARADRAGVTLKDIESIRATLPQLHPGQQEDVLKAETRFADPKGYGMLFTNGTGTGKTFSGLGVVKRFALQGKSNTLIVVPDDKIASDWIDSAKLLGLDVSQLKSTQDAGKGVVITSYASLGANDALASRQWDLVVADEAHSLMQSADGAVTGYLRNLRAITNHPDGDVTRHEMLNRDKLDEQRAINEKIKNNNKDMSAADTMPDAVAAMREENAKLKPRLQQLEQELRASMNAIEAEVKAAQGEARTRLVALSATPFAYEKTVDWANGYLFEYADGYPYGNDSRAYNQPDPREYFFQTRFGYRMRYGKLTAPDAKVDSGLMQRQFNGELKKSGALSGRMLDVAPDYDRRFVLVKSAIGNRIDEALEWLTDQAREAPDNDKGVRELGEAINEQFKYLQKRYLLEAIKATEVVPIVKQHMAMGRKVVVFHDYKKGGGFNPFKVEPSGGQNAGESQGAKAAQFNAALAAFNEKFGDLVNSNLGDMDSPIEVFKREFPNVMLVNGNEKKADLLGRYQSFQDDSTGPQVMLVQSAKNKGWSGHDTTGKHQRVLINLGQPTAPTLAIQQEGRIYRTGQASDAIMRYLNTGTNWERWTFASTIASRASTAENLGMGESARALKDSFIQSFEESDTYAPGHEGEGKGGKARDAAANNALTEYDRAKALYFSNAKKTSRTKAQEGVDYFATPEPVGLKMVEWLDVRGGESVLEPSGGHGAIARWFPEKSDKTVIEPSLALRSRLALAMNAQEDRIIAGTFEDHSVMNKYDGIAMNPPFGVGGKTAIEHLAKAATHLREGGRIVALIPVGPMADKRFDKWMNEASERPTKPLYTDPVHGPIYKGDTLTLSGFGSTSDIVVANTDTYGAVRYVRAEGVGKSQAVNIIAIRGVKPTGKRTEAYNPTADLRLVASITLPQSTFERAGTAVMTRIVVIEKQSDAGSAPANATKSIDLSNAESTEKLFDRLEGLSLPVRAKPQATEEAPDAAPAKAKTASKNAERNEKARAQSAAEGGTVKLGDSSYPIAKYTTNAGKEIIGAWVKTQQQALQYGPRTFQKKPLGWFVRERDFPAGAVSNDAANFAAKPADRPGTVQDKAVMQAIADGKSARDVLRLIAEQSKDPFRRQVARLLLKSGITPAIQFGHIGKTAKGDPIHGQYRGKTDTIAIAGTAERAAEHIFLHEAMHAATMRALAKPGMASLQLRKLLQHVQKQQGAGKFYGTTSVDEFVAEVFTNPDFQAALRKMTAPPGGTLKSAWDSFVRILRGILNLPNDSTNALSQALELGVAAMRDDMALRKQGGKNAGRDANMAAGNNGNFDPADPDIRNFSFDSLLNRSGPSPIDTSMGAMTPEQEATYKKVAGVQKVPTIKERMEAMKANLGLRMKQALVDQFAPIRDVSQRAYMLARMSKAGDAAIEALLYYGKPFMNDGVMDVKIGDGGFASVLASLKGEHDRFFMWVAAQRAERIRDERAAADAAMASLNAQMIDLRRTMKTSTGKDYSDAATALRELESQHAKLDKTARELLFDENDIAAFKSLNAGKMGDGTVRIPVYAKALQDLNDYNEAALKTAMESGLIDKDTFELMKGQPYVPFYRLMENDGAAMGGAKLSAGLTNQKAWEKLKGSDRKLNADLLQNVMQNWSHLYAASARNRAALATMDAAEGMGVAYKVAAETKGSVKVMRAGMTEHWMVEDPYLLEAVSALNYTASPLMKPLAKMKQLLTWGVTVNPTFKIRNLIRDSVSAISQSELGYNPLSNVGKGWKLTASDSQIYASMLASGGVIKFGTQENTDRLRSQVAKLGGVVLDEGGLKKFTGQLKSLYDAYAEFGDRTENVNRTALYDQLIKKGHSHAEASFMARDLMDFSMGGSHPAVRFLTQTVPFLNARLQGLYKLGRAAHADPRKFAAVAGAVSLASLALLAAYSDDEDWKKREDWDRDAYWWFKVGETAFRIPKPFEVGAIGTLAERTAEVMFEKEMTNKRFMERVAHMFSQTFAFDPVPQAIKPLLDIYANKDSFTKRAIESQADQRLRPQDRYNERTSEVARLLGSWGLPNPAQLIKGDYAGLSPKQIDHLLRGYFSWAGATAATVSDFGLRPVMDRGDRPDMRLRDVFIAGNFAESLPTGSSRYVSQLYEQSRSVEQAYASYREAIKMGDTDKAAQIQERDGPKLRNRMAYANATKQLSELNAQAKRIEANRLLPGDVKRERLTELELRRGKVAKRLSDMGAG